MALHITCSNCRQELQIPDEFVGKLLRCPMCKIDISTAPAARPQPEATQPSELVRLEQSILGPLGDEEPLRARPAADRPAPPRQRTPGRRKNNQPKPATSRFAIVAIVGVTIFVIALVIIALESGGRRQWQPQNVARPQFQDWAKDKRVDKDPLFAPNRLVLPPADDAFTRSEAERQKGDELNRAGQFEEARVHYRKALDIDPKNADAFFGLIRSLRMGDPRDDLAARFAKLDRLHENFDIFAQDCRTAHDHETLLILSEEMHRIDPNYLSADFCLTLAQALSGEAEQAADRFKKLLPRIVGAGKREEYVFAFMEAMAQADRADAAYEASDNRRESFRILATDLKRTYRMDSLRQLVNLHVKKHADDPLLPFFQAELCISDGDHSQAEKLFSKGMLQPPPANVLQQFRPSRVVAKYHTGKIQAAYADIGPRHDAFQQLAPLCWQDKKFAELQTLVDEHKKVEPDDRELGRYRWRLKARTQPVAEALAIFKTVCDKEFDANSRRNLTSQFLMDMVDDGKALEAYDAMDDPVQALQILAPDLRGQRRSEELRKLLERHRKRQPDDCWPALYEAESANEEKAWHKSIALFQAVWSKAPQDFRSRGQWVYVYAMYKAGRAMEAYEKIEPRDTTFAQLANNFVADKNGTDLLALVKAHRQRVGATAPVLMHEARAMIFLKMPGSATDAFLQAWEKAAGFERQDFLRSFLDAMADQALGLVAYRACPDKVQAFRTLASYLVLRKKDKSLSALLEEHVAGHGEDVWTLFYAGELALLCKEPGRAEKKFAAAKAKAPANDRWTFRNGLNRARVQAGHVVAAYQELGRNWRSFEDLAQICAVQKNGPQLEALLRAHRAAGFDGDRLFAWDVEVLWLAGEHAKLLEVLDRPTDDAPRNLNYRWKLDLYRVRCLVQLKRTDEAIKVAEDLAKKQRLSSVMVVLAHASTGEGDAKKAIAVVERYPNDRFLVEDCYRDEQLGPLLRSEPFREFREKYPEPPPFRDRFDGDD